MTEDFYKDLGEPTETEQEIFNRLMDIQNQAIAQDDCDLHLYPMSELPRFIPDKEDTEAVFQFVHNLTEGHLNIMQPYFVIDEHGHFQSKSWYETYHILLDAKQDLYDWSAQQDLYESISVGLEDY